MISTDSPSAVDVVEVVADENESAVVEPLEIDDPNDTDIHHPSPYLQSVLNYPCLMLLLSLLTVLPLSYLGVTRFSLSDPTGGQVVKDTLEAEQAHAFQTAAAATQGYVLV
mgnify:CR=1 FL=1|jgi:hypothetical protein|tara:strand:- start:111 stop:443 length:333 start_codon:yes stop_codon:yes gene_type:complete